MLAAFGYLGFTNIHHMNALKNLNAMCINGIAAVIFISKGLVDFRLALLMAAGGDLRRLCRRRHGTTPGPNDRAAGDHPHRLFALDLAPAAADGNDAGRMNEVSAVTLSSAARFAAVAFSTCSGDWYGRYAARITV